MAQRNTSASVEDAVSVEEAKDPKAAANAMLERAEQALQEVLASVESETGLEMAEARSSVAFCINWLDGARKRG
jgi:hypothetical protein